MNKHLILDCLIYLQLLGVACLAVITVINPYSWHALVVALTLVGLFVAYSALWAQDLDNYHI